MLSALATSLSTSPAFTDAVAHRLGNGGGPGWWVFLIPLVWIAFFVLVIALVRRFLWRHPAGDARHGAEGVLRERYARGEIDEQEYSTRLGVLKSTRRR